MGSGKRLIVRDLTSNFVHHRRGRLKKIEQSGYDPIPGAEAFLGFEDDGAKSPSHFERATLPPEWVDASDEAQEDIKGIREKFGQLKKAQEKRLLNLFKNDGEEDVQALTLQLTQLIRRCESSIHQVKKRGANEEGVSLADQEFRMNIQRQLAAQLSTLSKQCRETQKSYLDAIRKSQGGGQDLEAGGSSGAGGGGGGGGLLQAELETAERDAGNRSAEICQIASSFDELHGMFKELAIMVIDQGTVFDRIDYNMEQLIQKGSKANKHLQKTSEKKKKDDTRAFKCMASLGLINIILIILWLFRLKVKYGLSFASFFWTIFFVFAIIGGSFAMVKLKPQWCFLMFPTASSWLLSSEHNPNPQQQSGNAFSRWAGKAKSAVGLGGVNRQSVQAAQGVSAAMGAVRGMA